MDKLITVEAEVISINKQKGIITIKTISDKQYLCSCKDFLDYHHGDHIKGVCTRINNELKFMIPPIIIKLENKNQIVEFIGLFLKYNEKTREIIHNRSPLSSIQLCQEIYYQFLDLSEKHKCSIFKIFDYKKNGKIRDECDMIFKKYLKNKTVSDLLKHCYNKTCVRIARSLGITGYVLNSCLESFEELYDQCMTNPYSVLNLSIDVCNNICLNSNTIPTVEDIQFGNIMRFLESSKIQHRWTCIPVDYIKEKYHDQFFSLCNEKRLIDYKMSLDSTFLQSLIWRKKEVFIIEKIKEIKKLKKDYPFDIIFDDKTTDEQKSIIEHAINSNICLILGTAGTGKTHVIKELYNNLRMHTEVLVAAFPGKAVARINEVIGYDVAKTLHSSMCKSYLNYRTIIIDESSMVSTNLIFNVLKELKTINQIIMVGDVRQLDPIEIGNLLEELVDSNVIPIYRLTHNMRTNNVSDNGIYINSLKLASIDKTDSKIFTFTQTVNFKVFENSNLNQVIESVKMLLDMGVDVSMFKVITPYREQVEILNQEIKKIVNFNTLCVVDDFNNEWTLGDIVIIKENNYDHDVMNGMEAKITEILADELELQLKNSSRFVRISLRIKDDFNTGTLRLSYCLTVHSAQGSEWDIVYLYIPDKNFNMSFITNNLMYTAITRARKILHIYGSGSETYALNFPKQKYDTLSMRLKESLCENIIR
jgi:hypothetical protein